MIAPYCSALRERLKYGNAPDWVTVHIGLNCWDRAKRDTAAGLCATIWEGSDYDYPVAGCFVRMEILDGPSAEQCDAFVVSLLEQGAACVLLWWFDRLPIAYYPDGDAVELEMTDLREIFYDKKRADSSNTELAENTTRAGGGAGSGDKQADTGRGRTGT